MAINDEIAAGGRPVQFENPLNNMVKFANIQNDMANLQLHKQKAEADAAGMARKNELYNYLGSGGRDPNRIFQLGGHEELNQIRQGESARITGEKTAGESLDAAIKRGRGIFQDFVHTPQDARQFTYMQFTDPVMKKYMESLGVSFEQAVARIPTDPAEFRNYREQYVVGMDKHLDNLAFKTPHDAGDRILMTNTRGEVGGQPMIKGATMQQKIETDPEVLAGIARRDELQKQIAQGNPSGQAPVASQTNQLLNASVAQANDQTAPPIAPLAANVNRPQAEFEAVTTKLRADQERALAAKQNPDAKLALINDYYTRINNGEDPNSPSMKVRKGQIDFNQTRAEGSNTYFTTDQNGTVRAFDKNTLEQKGTLPGVGKPQQNIVQFGPDGLPIQNKALPQHAIEVQVKNRASIANIVSTLQDVATNPGAFGYQNMLPEAITQHLDPGGVTARANVANIGSLKLHDRSGANVTVGEVPRLRPFIPNITYDGAATIAKKLQGLQREIVIYQAEQDKAFAAQGYNTGSPAAAGTPPPAEPSLYKHPKTKGGDTANPLITPR
jgi:hypothetical protein